MDTSLPLADSPPGRDAVLMAELVALLGMVGASASAMYGQYAGVMLTSSDIARDRMLGAQVGVWAATLMWEVTFGAWALAAAVVLTAARFRAPSPPLHRVFRNLALPYAVLSVAFTLGMILVLPGLLLAVLALTFVDPVARGGGAGLGLVVPGGRRLLLLGGLFVGWSGHSLVWQMLGQWYVTGQGGWVEAAGHLTYQLLTFACWVGWCAIVRAAPAVESARR